MIGKLTGFAACLSLAAAFPTIPELVGRQADPSSSYPDNGTLIDAPNATALTRPNPNYTQKQLDAIKLAYTASDRLALLKSYGNPNDYFKFDLTPNGSASNAANGLGGQGYLAHVGNYPVLMGTGLSVAIGYLNPCGLDSMHVHNRATEMVTLVSGQSLKTGFVLEDGFGKLHPVTNSPTTTNISQIYQSRLRLASTKAPSAPWAPSTGSSTTTASPLSSLPRSPMKTPVSHAQPRTSSSTHKRLLTPTLHTQAGSTM